MALCHHHPHSPRKGRYRNMITVLFLIAFTTMVVGSPQHLVSHMRRQEFYPVPTGSPTPTETDSSPCYSKMISLLNDEPTLAPQVTSWMSAADATVTDYCPITMPASLRSYIDDYFTQQNSWSSAHESEIKSVASECGPYIESYAASAQSSMNSLDESCSIKTGTRKVDTTSVLSVPIITPTDGSTKAAPTSSGSSSTSSTSSPVATKPSSAANGRSVGNIVPLLICSTAVMAIWSL
jgi:hypothetical protein